MSVLSRDEFFNRVQARVGDDTSDDAISFIEDMTDTFNSLEERANGDGENWEQRYRELDESWKKKYKHRFFSGGAISSPVTGEDGAREEDEYDGEEVTFDDLFVEKKEEK